MPTGLGCVLGAPRSGVLCSLHTHTFTVAEAGPPRLCRVAHSQPPPAVGKFPAWPRLPVAPEFPVFKEVGREKGLSAPEPGARKSISLSRCVSAVPLGGAMSLSEGVSSSSRKTIDPKLILAAPPLNELHPYPQLLSRHHSPRLPGLQDSCPPVSLLTATVWLIKGMNDSGYVASAWSPSCSRG